MAYFPPIFKTIGYHGIFGWCCYRFSSLPIRAYQSLDQLSNRAAITNKNALADTERSEVMRNLAIEMEGNYRRYCVLRDKTDEEMYQQRYQQYSKMFSTLQQTIIPLSESKEAQALNTSLKTLKSIQCKNSEPTSSNATGIRAIFLMPITALSC